MLTAPAVDRLRADAKVSSDVGDLPASIDQVENLASTLRWVTVLSDQLPTTEARVRPRLDSDRWGKSAAEHLGQSLQQEQ